MKNPRKYLVWHFSTMFVNMVFGWLLFIGIANTYPWVGHALVFTGLAVVVVEFVFRKYNPAYGMWPGDVE